MKKFLISAGKAACYVALYIFTQFIVSYAFIFFWTLVESLNNPKYYNNGDLSYYISQTTQKLYEHTTLIIFISGIIMVAVLALFFKTRKKHFFKEIWLVPVKPSSLLPVLIFGAALAVFISIGISYIPWPQWALDDYDQLYAVTGDEGWIGLVITVLAVPFFEETLFRGLVFTRLCEGMPGPAALILAATVFGALHGTFVWAAYGFICGVALTLIMMKYRSITASITVHMIFNLTGGYLLGFLDNTAAWVGPAMFIASVFALAAISVYIYRMPRSKIDHPAKINGGNLPSV